MTRSLKSIEDIIKRDLGASYRLVRRQPGEDAQEESSSPPDAVTPEIRPRYRARVHVTGGVTHPVKPPREGTGTPEAQLSLQGADEEMPLVLSGSDSARDESNERFWTEEAGLELDRDSELFLVENARLPADAPAARRTVIVSRRDGRVIGEQG